MINGHESEKKSFAEGCFDCLSAEKFGSFYSLTQAYSRSNGLNILAQVFEYPYRLVSCSLARPHQKLATIVIEAWPQPAR